MALAGFLPPSSNKSGFGLIKVTVKVADLKKIKPIKEQTTISAIAKSFKKSDISSKSGALVKSGKGSEIVRSEKKGALVRNEEEKTEEQIIRVKVKVIKLRDMFRDRYVYDKKRDSKENIERSRREKNEKEKEREGKKKKFNIGKLGALMPKMGILDAIQNFLLYTILGYLNNRFDILPKLIGLIPLLAKAMDFIVNIGGIILNGLVTFIDFGYGLVDKTRGFIKGIGGEGAAKVFDKFLGTLNTILNLAFIAAMIGVGGGFGKGKKGGKPGGKPRGRPGTGGRPKVTTSGGKGAGRPDIRNPLRNKPPVTTSGGGKTGRPDIRNPLRSKPNVTQGRGGGGFRNPFKPKAPVTGGGGFTNPFKSFKIPKISPGSLLKGGASVGIGILADMGINALADTMDEKTSQDIANKIKAYSPEERTKSIAKIQKDLKKEKDYQASPLHLFDKGIKLGGETQSERQANVLRSILEKLGETPKYAAGGVIGYAPGGFMGGLPMMMGMPSLPRMPKLTLPNFSIQSVGKTISGGINKFFEFFGGGSTTATVNDPPPYLKGLADLANKVKDVPLIGGAMFAALQLAMGAKVNRNVFGVIGNQLTNFSLQDSFSGITSSASKLSALKFISGGQVPPSTIVSVTPSGQRKSVNSLTSFLDKEVRTIELEVEEEKLKKELDSGGGGAGGGGGDDFEAGPAGTSGDKLTMARNLMRDLGLTADQAAGIVGNMAAESGVENARVQGSRPGEKGVLKVDGKTGYGIVQWTSMGRQQALADYAKSRGADLNKPLSMNIEYQFFLKEFKGKYGHVLSQLKQAKDVKTASTIFMQQYEVPAGYKTEAKIMERYNMSKPVYDKLALGQGKATEGAGTYIASSGSSSSSTSPGGAIPKGSVAQWLHGTPGRAGYDAGHAGESNAHDHFGFKSRSAADAAFKKLRSSGYKPYEFEGYTSVGNHSPSGGHYGPVGGKPTYSDKTDGTAFDIPWATYGSGPINKKDYAMSLNAAKIVGAAFRGGSTGKGGALMVHPGEYVIDKDSVDLFGLDFIKTINDVENRSNFLTKAYILIDKLKKLIASPGDKEKKPETPMDKFKKANPELAAAQEERDRIKGTSQTNNPLMKGMTSRMPMTPSIQSPTLKKDLGKFAGSYTSLTDNKNANIGPNEPRKIEKWKSVKENDGFNVSKPKSYGYQGGGYIGGGVIGNKYNSVSQSASYDQPGMMIMIQPMIIEKPSLQSSGGGKIDFTSVGGSIDNVNPVASRG
jgi:hypothetical protein